MVRKETRKMNESGLQRITQEILDFWNEQLAKDNPFRKLLETPEMSANEKQIGGQHYKSKIEHWDYVIANGIPYMEAQIIKYLTRWRSKNGMEDLYKAKHFLEKLIEVEN